MKKVLFVATVVRLHINMFHKPFIKWFHDQGWQVDVAANNDYDNPEDCVIPYCDHYYCMPFERSPLKKGNLDTYFQLKELLDKEHYDIIHCHTPMGSVIARLAAISSRNRGTKVIYTAHGFHFYDGAPLVNWLVYYPIERILSRWTDLLITMNSEDYQRSKTFHAKRTQLINGVGIDLHRFCEATPEDKLAVRQELGLSDGETFAITVGNLIPRKNHATLINAIARINDPKLHLFICGDGELDAELKSLSNKLNAHNVHFLGFRRDIFHLCSAADLFLFASRQEGLPVAVMEAMASGLPIVASHVRGNIDLIDPDKGGYLVEADDVDGFANAIRRILEDHNNLDRMRSYNLDKIRAYSLETIILQMAQLYKTEM